MAAREAASSSRGERPRFQHAPDRVSDRTEFTDAYSLWQTEPKGGTRFCRFVHENTKCSKQAWKIKNTSNNLLLKHSSALETLGCAVLSVFVSLSISNYCCKLLHKRSTQHQVWSQSLVGPVNHNQVTLFAHVHLSRNLNTFGCGHIVAKISIEHPCAPVVFLFLLVSSLQFEYSTFYIIII